MDARRGEKPKTRFRGSQLFPAGGKWYFTTREGLDVGPFDQRAEAQINSTRLRLVLAKIDDPELVRTVIVRYLEIPQEYHADLRSMLLYIMRNMRADKKATG